MLRNTVQAALRARVGARLVATGLRAGQTTSARTARVLGAAFAATAAAAVTATAVLSATDLQVVKNNATGLEFPATLPASRFGTPVEGLLGTGCRYKYGYVKVYAVGLYVDLKASTAVAAVKMQNPFNEESTAKSAEFYDKLALEDCAATILIKMSRAVDSATMVGALEEALKPRVESKNKASLGSLEQFKTLLSKALGTQGVNTDTDLQFLRAPGGLLHIVVNGTPAGCVRDPALIWALFDVYLGKNSVTPDLRKDVANTLSKLLT